MAGDIVPQTNLNLPSSATSSAASGLGIIKNSQTKGVNSVIFFGSLLIVSFVIWKIAK